MGYIFRYNSTTGGRTPKRTMPSDSAHRIGPSTLSKDVLTAEEEVCGWKFIEWQNRTHFPPYLQNQGPYGQTDNAIRFSASNRSINPIERCSDCRRSSLCMEIYKLRNFER